MTAKLTYFVLTFGILMPFTLGLMVELFIVLPLRNAIDEDASVIFMVVRVCALSLGFEQLRFFFILVLGCEVVASKAASNDSC